MGKHHGEHTFCGAFHQRVDEGIHEVFLIVCLDGLREAASKNVGVFSI